MVIVLPVLIADGQLVSCDGGIMRKLEDGMGKFMNSMIEQYSSGFMDDLKVEHCIKQRTKADEYRYDVKQLSIADRVICSLPDVAFSSSPEDICLEMEKNDVIFNYFVWCKHLLSPRDWQILCESIVLGWNHKKIAAYWGMHANTVRLHIVKSIQIIREMAPMYNIDIKEYLKG